MQKEDSIYIIGAGAIGKALATFLKLEGKEVVIIRGSVDHKPVHTEKVRVELPGKTTVEAEIEINTASNFSALNGIVVFTNKSFGNQHLAATLKTKINNSPILILQNGLNIEQPFIDAGYPEIYRCVLFATCQFLLPNVLRFKPVAASPIGSIKGSGDNLNAVAGQVNNRHFQFRAEENIQPLIWTKTIVNCIFNSVCPLLETDNGIFHRNQNALHIAERVIAGCVAVAESKGIYLKEDEVMNTLLSISQSSDGQLISTYQDIMNKRRTEIETLNFAIADSANTSEQAGAVIETRLLGELVKLKSELSMDLPVYPVAGK
ncbi:MAG TPA: 2-dehydropantoate 2-reductase [Chitinophagaceae bacterium]|nr:2-dehydropantoate 2-reductase [Chitinophagaceae bacterium]